MEDEMLSDLTAGMCRGLRNYVVSVWRENSTRRWSNSTRRGDTGAGH